MVMKVRARSSAAFRAVAFDAARISAVAEWEMDVIHAPARVIASDVAAGDPIQQGPIVRLQRGERNPGLAHFLSLRGANGSRDCAPDDRLRDEPIQLPLWQWIVSLTLAMTVEP